MYSDTEAIPSRVDAISHICPSRSMARTGPCFIVVLNVCLLPRLPHVLADLSHPPCSAPAVMSSVFLLGLGECRHGGTGCRFSLLQCTIAMISHLLQPCQLRSHILDTPLRVIHFADSQDSVIDAWNLGFVGGQALRTVPERASVVKACAASRTTELPDDITRPTQAFNARSAVSNSTWPYARYMRYIPGLIGASCWPARESNAHRGLLPC